MAVSINVQAEVWKALRGVGGESGILRAEFCRFSVLWGPVFRGLAGGEARVLCASPPVRGWLWCVTMCWKRDRCAQVSRVRMGKGTGVVPCPELTVPQTL